MVSQKVTKAVTPAKAGVQNYLRLLDSDFRRNDEKERVLSFCEAISQQSVHTPTVILECFNRGSSIAQGRNWIPAQKRCGNDDSKARG